MSPEPNGNPPSVTKRKKNKKIPSTNGSNTFDLNMSSCNYFPLNPYPYQNLSIPDVSSYYSYNNCEPMSLPIYPMSYVYPTNGSKHSTLPNHSGLHSNEYTSLPVVNMDQNEETSKRRFSDPGLPNESDSSSNSFDERLIHKLTQQVNSLKESNKKLSREMMEMRVELNLLKQQNMRQFDREYEPGMLADIIREVRDAARVREDALLAKVKHILEEKQFSMSHMQLVSEKNRNNDRISKLEEQLKNISINTTSSDESHVAASLAIEGGSGTARQVLELEREVLELRRELQDTRARRDEADQKLIQQDKKLSRIMRRGDNSFSDVSDSLSTASTMSQSPRVTLSGPVTDL